MEEQVYAKLSTTERELFANLWEQEVFKAIIKAGDAYQKDKALHIAMVAPDMNNVILNRGMIQGVRFIYDLAHYAHKKRKKSEP